MKKIFALTASTLALLFGAAASADDLTLESGSCIMLNDYKLLITVGMDEALPASAVGGTGFSDILGWDTNIQTQFRIAAVEWFLERFGIDFTAGTYDPTTDITLSNDGTAVLVPISFTGTYRVLSTNNDRIPVYSREHRSTVRLAEYVVQFFAPPTYGGTYADGTPVPGTTTDNLAYGCYKIHGRHQDYFFFMRSFYPDKTDPTNPAVYPPRSSERFQMYSTVFGPGAGILDVIVPTTPDSNGQFPTFTRASWSFPGSNVIPDLNGYTQAPVQQP